MGQIKKINCTQLPLNFPFLFSLSAYKSTANPSAKSNERQPDDAKQNRKQKEKNGATEWKREQIIISFNQCRISQI